MKHVQLGLKENWKQFTLLVIINAFVGGMVGLERSILPQIAEKEFAIAAKRPYSHLLSYSVLSKQSPIIIREHWPTGLEEKNYWFTDGSLAFQFLLF